LFGANHGSPHRRFNRRAFFAHEITVCSGDMNQNPDIGFARPFIQEINGIG
jgi:hypothetical protein